MRCLLGSMASDVIRQRVGLSLEYPVIFTRDAFDAASTTLADLIPKPAKLVVYIDDGVAAAWPNLVAQVVAYAKAHALEMLAPPEVMMRSAP